jgi:hypothetical protein
VRNDSRTQLQDWIARMNAGDDAAKNELLRYAYARLRRLALLQFAFCSWVTKSAGSAIPYACRIERAASR